MLLPNIYALNVGRKWCYVPLKVVKRQVINFLGAHNFRGVAPSKMLPNPSRSGYAVSAVLQICGVCLGWQCGAASASTAVRVLHFNRQWLWQANTSGRGGMWISVGSTSQWHTGSGKLKL